MAAPSPVGQKSRTVWLSSLQAEIKILAGNIVTWSSGSFSRLIPVTDRIHSLTAVTTEVLVSLLSTLASVGDLRLLKVAFRSREPALKGENMLVWLT